MHNKQETMSQVMARALRFSQEMSFSNMCEKRKLRQEGKFW